MVVAQAPMVSCDKVSPITAEPEPWAISPITLGEQESIAGFYAAFENEKRPIEFWRERLRLWWQGNPAFETSWPLGVKMTAGDHVVGVLCAIPVKVRHSGMEVIGAALTSWRVEKDHRIGSIGMFEAILEAHAARPIFDTTPTPGVVRLLNHYGFSRPLEHFPAARLLCNPWRLIARVCGAPPVSIGASQVFINDRAASLEDAAVLIDELWTQQSPPFSDMGVKDGAYFRWYMRDGRTNGRFGLVTTHACGIPSGMAIVLDMGKGVAWLADLWCDFNNPAAVHQLVVCVRKRAARLGFHCLWVPHFHAAVAEACGRHRIRPLPVSAFFKYPAAKSVTESSYWTLAVGDFGA